MKNVKVRAQQKGSRGSVQAGIVSQNVLTTGALQIVVQTGDERGHEIALTLSPDTLARYWPEIVAKAMSYQQPKLFSVKSA